MGCHELLVHTLSAAQRAREMGMENSAQRFGEFVNCLLEDILCKHNCQVKNGRSRRSKNHTITNKCRRIRFGMVC